MVISEHIALRVAQIVSTEKRKVVMNVIIEYGKPFSVIELCNKLNEKKISIRLTAVLNLVKRLHQAGLLYEDIEVRTSKKEGRPRNLYTLVSDQLDLE